MNPARQETQFQKKVRLLLSYLASNDISTQEAISWLQLTEEAWKKKEKAVFDQYERRGGKRWQ